MSDSLPQRFVEALREVCPDPQTLYALHEPCFEGNEWRYVKECLDTGWVSSVGPFVDRYERELASYAGTKFGVAVANGTSALHAILRVLGVTSLDEVLLPSLTFIATANSVAYCGAQCHFADIEMGSLGIDAQKLDAYLDRVGTLEKEGFRNRQSGRRIAALIVMHCFGHPVDLDALKAVSEKYRIPLIEDAAESLGSLYRGRHSGSHGVMTALSFNGNKTITTGGGGAILTNDERLATRLKHITTTARVPHAWRYAHDEVGYNYRLPNINAALGVAQLEQLPGFLGRKRTLAQRYLELFRGVSGLTIFQEPSYAKSNYWLNTALLDEPNIGLRDSLINEAVAQNIFVRPAWEPLHTLPMYAACPRMDLSTTEQAVGRIINLPSSVKLSS